MDSFDGHTQVDEGPAGGIKAGARDRLDSGYLALLGHRLLGAVSVAAGARETLALDDGRIAPADRLLLEDAIERSLLEVADGARSLVHGVVSLP